MKKFRYSLKLTNGKRVYGEGFNVEDAARDAKVSVVDIKRAMPITRVLTDDEKKAKKLKDRARRKQARAALKIAREVQKRKREAKNAM